MGIASDSTGQFLTAVAQPTGGGIYTSTDYGTTWSQVSLLDINWDAVASSSSGSVVVALVNGGGIYTSLVLTPQPSPSPTFSPTTPLQADPFSLSTWSSPANVRVRVHHYIYTYATYFLVLFFIFLGLDKLRAVKNLSDQIYLSSFESKVYIDFYNRSVFDDDGPLLLNKYLSSYSQKSPDDSNIEIDATTTTRISDIGLASITTDKAQFIDYHKFILSKHAYFGSKGVLYPDGVKIFGFMNKPGWIEDLLVYTWNNHAYFQCFASIDYYPVSLQSKRLIFLSNYAILFFCFVVINDILIFRLNFQNSETLLIFILIAHPTGILHFFLYISSL